ncbi:MAG TPA: 30S ribosomal protein S1 [Bryobacterales bacterium]|nr:30S ribosomal protein S1 [Bryobacterales bacterium]
MNSNENLAEASFGELLQAYETTHGGGPGRRAGPDQPRKGIVAAVVGDRVFVDIGGKSEGIIPVEELRGPDGALAVHRGDEITVAISGRDSEGYLLLSPVAAGRPRDWSGLERAFQGQEIIAGRVTGAVKGGLSVDVGVRAFLPASRSGCRETADLEKLIGEEIRCRILQLDIDDENVILDRRAVLEEEAQAARQALLARLEEGAVMRGTVRSLTEFGAFVDLGGVDGLLHVGDMSWSRVADPKTVVSPGDEIDVKILHIDRQKPRIALGLKQLTPDPWAEVAERLKPGERVKGVVTRLMDFGAFVEIAPGVEGLVHVSEMSWAKRVRHPRDLVKPGDVVEVVVLSAHPAERRVSLGLKQALGDPWADADERFRAGKVVEGTVRNLQKFGAFVELADGVEGLLHISDITGDRRLNHPNEALQLEQRVRAVVLEVDKGKKRIKLGMKQLEPDSSDEYIAEHKPGEAVTGRVVRIENGAARVELGEGVEGFCRLGDQPRPAAVGSFGAQLAAVWKGAPATPEPAGEPLQAGQVRSFRILSIDAASKRIELAL